MRQVLAQKASDLGVFKELLQSKDFQELILLAKNPKIINEAHENAIKQLNLTDDLIKKGEQAKDNIQKNQDLLTEINKQKQQLSDLKIQHDKNTSELDSKNAKIRDDLRALNEKIESNKEFFIRSENEKLDISNKLHDLHIRSQKLDDRQKYLDEFEKSLNARAERVLLREKASGL